jgi:hypothetical protein
MFGFAMVTGLAFPAKFQAGASWSRLPAAFPLSERHAWLEQVYLSLSVTIDRVFKSSNIRRYPDLVGHLGAQISFSEDFESFSFATPL